jgi:hypothetical protein
MSIPLTPRITAFPVRHGRAVFAMELRKLLWKEKFDALAFAWPASLRDAALEGVDALPAIRAAVIRVDGGVRAYLPFDPCDAYIEGLRQARQSRLPVHFLEDDALLDGPHRHSLPDAYLARAVGLDKYYEVVKSLPSTEAPDARLSHRGYLCLAGLRRLEKSHRRILFLCDFPLLRSMEKLFREQSVEDVLAEAVASSGGEAAAVETSSYPIKPGLLFFALGEPPFYAGEMEKERADVLAAPLDYLDLVKKMFTETRNQFLSGPGEAAAETAGAVSVKKVQTALIFLRNLAAQEGRLSPDLLDIVTAAKGVFGNSFAAKVLEAARFYPFFEPEESEAPLEIGRDHIHEPGQDEPLPAFNLLEDEQKVWKTISLKKEPDRQRQQSYRYSWDPRGMCSHSPEDDRIEGFNRTVRRRSQDMALQAFARTEKLTTSLKDGIDVRETLRNFTTGGVYVKEVPPVRGRVDTVVIIFDGDHDDRYPQRTTWYAEHDEESTLTFYATDPLAKMIGPGIAESEYGGLSLLFPPRPVANVFESPTDDFGFQNLAEQLVYGALLNSKERFVAYVAQRKPGMRMRRMASQFGKRLLWVPLGSFSAETLRRLRKFHVLNGKHVRAWASRFIPE